MFLWLNLNYLCNEKIFHNKKKLGREWVADVIIIFVLFSNKEKSSITSLFRPLIKILNRISYCVHFSKRKKFSHLLQWRKIERGAVLKHIGASSNTQFSKAIISIPTFLKSHIRTEIQGTSSFLNFYSIIT